LELDPIFIKIDVQGVELGVLRGLEKTKGLSAAMAQDAATLMYMSAHPEAVVKPNIRLFGAGIPGSEKALESLAESASTARTGVAKAVNVVARNVPRFGKDVMVESAQSREALDVIKKFRRQTESRQSGQAASLIKEFEAAVQAGMTGGQKIADSVKTLAKIENKNARAMWSHLTESGLLELPMESAVFRRAFETLPSDAWRDLVMSLRSKAGFMFRNEDFADTGISMLGAGTKARLDRLQIDKGNVVKEMVSLVSPVGKTVQKARKGIFATAQREQSLLQEGVKRLQNVEKTLNPVLLKVLRAFVRQTEKAAAAGALKEVNRFAPEFRLAEDVLKSIFGSDSPIAQRALGKLERVQEKVIKASVGTKPKVSRFLNAPGPKDKFVKGPTVAPPVSTPSFNVVKPGKQGGFGRAESKAAAARSVLDATRKEVDSLLGDIGESIREEIAALTRRQVGIETKAQSEAARSFPRTEFREQVRELAKYTDEIEAVSDQMLDIEYLAHTLTPEFRILMEKHEGWKGFDGFSKTITPEHVNMLARKLLGTDEQLKSVGLGREWKGTITAINKLGQAGQIIPGVPVDVFITDALLISLLRSHRSLKASQSGLLARELSQYGFFPPKEIDEAFTGLLRKPTIRELEDMVPKGHRILTGPMASHPALEGSYFPREVANAIEKYYNPKAKMNEVVDFMLAATDEVQNAWVRTTLLPFPGTALRDMRGNLWNTFLVGSLNVKAGVTAMRNMIKDTFGIIKGNHGSVKTPHGTIGWERIRQAATDEGVFGRGQIAGQVGGGLGKESIEDVWQGVALGSGTRTPILQKWAAHIPLFSPETTQRIGTVQNIVTRIPIPDSKNPILNLMAAVRSFMDDLFRMMVFVDGVKKGDTFSGSALRVKKCLFGAEMLSPFERQVLRRVFPFYRWSRANIPFQISEGFKTPWKVLVAKKLVDATMSGFLAQKEKDWLPTFVQWNWPYPMGRDKDGNPVIGFMKGDLPLADLEGFNVLASGDIGNIVRQLPGIGLSQLTPFLKIPIEAATNADLFTGRELTEAPIKQLLRIPWITDGVTVDTRTLTGKALVSLDRNMRLIHTLDQASESLKDDTDKSKAAETTWRWLTGMPRFLLSTQREMTIAEKRFNAQLLALKYNMRDAIESGNKVQQEMILKAARDLMDRAKRNPESFRR